MPLNPNVNQVIGYILSYIPYKPKPQSSSKLYQVISHIYIYVYIYIKPKPINQVIRQLR